jgi:hypothetical protein
MPWSHPGRSYGLVPPRRLSKVGFSPSETRTFIFAGSFTYVSRSFLPFQ